MRVDGGIPPISHGSNTSRPIHRQVRSSSIVEIGHSRHTFSSAAFSGWSPILVPRFCTWSFAVVPIQLLRTTCVDCRLPTLHGSTLLRCEARTRCFVTWSRRRRVDDASATKRDETSEKKRRFFSHRPVDGNGTVCPFRSGDEPLSPSVTKANLVRFQTEVFGCPMTESNCRPFACEANVITNYTNRTQNHTREMLRDTTRS